MVGVWLGAMSLSERERERRECHGRGGAGEATWGRCLSLLPTPSLPAVKRQVPQKNSAMPMQKCHAKTNYPCHACMPKQRTPAGIEKSYIYREGLLLASLFHFVCYG